MSAEISLIDAVAVVTGAASGIGLAVSRRLASDGARVVMADVSPGRLAAATERVREDCSGEVLPIVANVAEPDSVAALADAAFSHFGRVDILHNNAGVVVNGPTWELTTADWEFVMGVNFWGTVHGLTHFLPRMIDQGTRGHIVNTASVAGHLGYAGNAPYTASKFAVVGTSEALHNDLRRANVPIGVSVLCPGIVRTNLRETTAEVRGAAPADASPAASQAHVQTLMQPIEPAAVAERVVDAIRENRFWIFTHPQYYELLDARLDGIRGVTDIVIDPPLI